MLSTRTGWAPPATWCAQAVTSEDAACVGRDRSGTLSSAWTCCLSAASEETSAWLIMTGREAADSFREADLGGLATGARAPLAALAALPAEEAALAAEEA